MHAIEFQLPENLMYAEEDGPALRIFLHAILRRSRVDSLFVGIFGTLYGWNIHLGGAKTINSILVRMVWPLYVVGGLLCLAWAFRPHLVWLANIGGWLSFMGWGSRALLAVAWGINTGRFFSPACWLVFTSHIMVARILYSVWVGRIIAIAKSVEMGYDR